ncbi:MAG: hypothetical protein RLZZ28_1409 [Bacteroidota bacterium]
MCCSYQNNFIRAMNKRMRETVFEMELKPWLSSFIF